MMDHVIQLDHVTKIYEDTIALNDINIDLEPGKVYGLVGRNGAGKTTLLKLMAQMMQSTQGEIIYNPKYIKGYQDICFARDYNQYFANQRIKNILFTASKIYPNWDQDLEKELIDVFELPIKKLYSKGSKGMQTMVSIIVALCSNAKVILLDEPYSGLDPVNREYFYKHLRERYFDGERTVLLSSHLINEIEGYFEKAIIIHKGNILINEDTEKIYKQSFIISCNEEVSKKVKTEKKVLKEEKMAGEITLYIYDQLSAMEKEIYLSMGAHIKGMDLQKLMVALCTRMEGRV